MEETDIAGHAHRVGHAEGSRMLSALSVTKRRILGLLSLVRRREKSLDDIGILDSNEVHRLLDDLAQKELGMSGDAFLQAVERGEIDDPRAEHLLLIAGARAR